MREGGALDKGVPNKFEWIDVSKVKTLGPFGVLLGGSQLKIMEQF